MWKDFKAFLSQGNVLNLAVGIVIGTAFGQIVSTLVGDVIMPPIGLLLGHANFSNLYINLSSHHYASYALAQAAGAPVIAYGLFINTLIDFFIVALVIFLALRSIKRLQRPQAAAPATTQPCPFCISAIPLQATRCPFCTSELAKAE